MGRAMVCAMVFVVGWSHGVLTCSNNPSNHDCLPSSRPHGIGNEDGGDAHTSLAPSPGLEAAGQRYFSDDAVLISGWRYPRKR